MIVATTSLTLYFAFRKPTIPPQTAPVRRATRIQRSHCPGKEGIHTATM